jgi:hypothetical protein
MKALEQVFRQVRELASAMSDQKEDKYVDR